MDIKLIKKPGEGHFSWSIKNGDFEIVDKKQEILQRVIFAVLTVRKENYRDPDFGVDYIENVFGKNIDDVILQDSFKVAILKTTGVTGLQEYSLEQVKETLKIKATIETLEGDVKFNFDLL